MITPCGLDYPAFQHNDQIPSIQGIYITSRGDTNFDYSLSVFSSFCLFILFYHVRKRSSKYDRQRRQVVFCSKKLVIEYFCGKFCRLRFETLAYKIILLHFIAVYRWYIYPASSRLRYVEQGMETQGSDGLQSDLFEGFISIRQLMGKS